MVYRLPLNVGSCSPRAPLVDVPEGGDEGKYCQWAELQGLHLCFHLTWNEKWLDG